MDLARTPTTQEDSSARTAPMSRGGTLSDPLSDPLQLQSDGLTSGLSDPLSGALQLDGPLQMDGDAPIQLDEGEDVLKQTPYNARNNEFDAGYIKTMANTAETSADPALAPARISDAFTNLAFETQEAVGVKADGYWGPGSKGGLTGYLTAQSSQTDDSSSDETATPETEEAPVEESIEPTIEGVTVSTSSDTGDSSDDDSGTPETSGPESSSPETAVTNPEESDQLAQEMAEQQQKEKQETESQETAIEEASADLGEVDNMEEALDLLGSMLDAMAPSEGDSKKIKVSMGVKPSPAVSLGFDMALQVSRQDNGKLKTKANIGFNAKVEADFYLASAFAKVSLAGYLQAVGDNGSECIDLFGLAMYTTVASASKKAARYVWGKDFEDDVMSEMDDDDSVEMGLEASAGVGASIGGGIDIGGDDVDASIKASGEGKLSTKAMRKITRDGVEDSTSSSASAMASLKVSGSIPGTGWAGSLGLTAKYATGGGVSGEIAANLTRDADMEAFVSALTSGNFNEQLISWVAGTADVIADLILGTTGLQDDAGGGRTLGAVVGAMGSTSLAASIGQGALLEKVQSKFAGVGASMKQALDVKLTFKDGKAKLDVKLSRASSIDVGGDVKLGKLEVAVENLSEIVKIPTVTI